MPLPKTAQFLVTVSVPEGHDRKWVRDYIREAVTMWSGQDDPEGPTFYFCSPHFGRVCTVRHVKEPRK